VRAGARPLAASSTGAAHSAECEGLRARAVSNEKTRVAAAATTVFRYPQELRMDSL